MAGLIWFIVGFIACLYIALMIWFIIADRKKWNKVEDFLKRHMKPKSYIEYKELEEQSIWRTLALK